MKTFTVIRKYEGKEYSFTGTLQELISIFSYTLQKGKTWEREKGSKKINVNPKGIKSLIVNLNKAVDNSASNGYSGVTFELGM